MHVIPYLIAGVLGMAAHIFCVKLPSVIKRAKAANHPFSAKEYFSSDWPAIVASFLTVVIVAFVWDEIVGYKPGLDKIAKMTFVSVGFMGSSLLIAALGKASEKILKIVDFKTDVADGKIEK
jgi:hypothetical protein